MSENKGTNIECRKDLNVTKLLKKVVSFTHFVVVSLIKMDYEQNAYFTFRLDESTGHTIKFEIRMFHSW
jgi:hypothetical protein